MNNERQETNYLDFELKIDHGIGREYPISVIDSPAGEARETMHFPYDELVLENRLKSLQIALLHSGGKRRLVKSTEEQTVQDFGRDLFAALICGEVRSRYDVSLSKAAQQDKGLRLKLRIRPPELATLPWEFIFDERQGEYLSLSRKTPIIRYIELPQPIKPLTVTPPLRILGMIANPNGLPSIEIEREKLRIERAVDNLKKRGLVQLTWLPGQTWRDLQSAMLEGPWHIFHFIGHGGFDSQKDEGLICLSDEDGKNHLMSASQLGILLADHTSLRLTLLNSCEGARGGNRDIFSSSASILVRHGIPAVIAMQYEITDGAAVEFARTFYESLARSLPIDASVGEARKSIRFAINNTLEWGTPVLYMRSTDGILFSLAQKSEIKKDFQDVPDTKEKKSPPLVAAEQDKLPIKDLGNLIPKAATPKAILSNTTKETTPAKPAKTLQEQVPHHKPTPEKVPPGFFSMRLRNKPLSLIAIIFIIAFLTAFLIQISGVFKNREVVEKLKEMPADVKKVEKKGIKVYRNEKDCYEADFRNGVIMVYIPAGDFTMGSNDEFRDEKPEHRVYLDSYWIGKYEVTVGQFKKFVNDTGYKTEAEKNGGTYVWVENDWQKKKDINWQNPYFLQGDNNPVVCVSWNDAQAYIKWLSEEKGFIFKLPTEAQWEKAARGKDGLIYPWGNGFGGGNCNSDYLGLGKTYPVVFFPEGVSPYGCFNMTGNVSEWCSDWYVKEYYKKSPNKNPIGPPDGSGRILRGGNWASSHYFDCRASSRNFAHPAERWIGYGFRLAMSL